MTSPTQTMENTTEVECISTYDKPKRARGRPTTCKLSDEEKSRGPQKLYESIITAIMSIVSFNSEAINSQFALQKNETQKTNYFLAF